ncbi:MAG: elongation factor P [Candidatus Theseobacter exili]|nr:elongation factor P [Candidatus Theseobacter exili]
MVSTNSLKANMTLVVNGELYNIVSFQHVKPGKGGAFVRTKLRQIKNNSVLDKTFRAGEDVEQAFIEDVEMEYLYNNGQHFIFMDLDSYEQNPVEKEVLVDVIDFLKENTVVRMKLYSGNIIGVELPFFMELTVSETDPGFKGDTVTGGTKPATLETGAIIQVPLFVEVGDVLKVDTRTGQYIQRV